MGLKARQISYLPSVRVIAPRGGLSGQEDQWSDGETGFGNVGTRESVEMTRHGRMGGGGGKEISHTVKEWYRNEIHSSYSHGVVQKLNNEIK